jgi:hypothetical protein
MPRYRAYTWFSLEGEPVRDGELLPEAFTSEPGNHYQLDQWLANGTIRPVPEDNAPQVDAAPAE